MQRSIALYIAALLMLCFTKANAATADRSFQYNDTVRTYTLYIPDNATARFPL